VSVKGLPFSQRGAVLVEVAGMQVGGNNPAPIASIDLIARIPILPHTFIDADLPIGFGAVGNPMVGVHHVFHPTEPFWITLGGAFGFPLINAQGFENFAFANGLWDAERFILDNVPFALRFGMEWHVGIAEFRLDLHPVWGISHVRSSDTNQFGGVTSPSQPDFYAFQHALEIQIGHAIGGGIRYQGVVVATNNEGIIKPSLDNTAAPDGDRYQGVLEPFFRLYRDPVFFRFGLQMPVDKPLGAPFSSAWGIKGTLGYSLD
jgi:hypothetical protein